MNYAKSIIRPLPAAMMACLLAACSSAPGFSLGGAAAPQIAAPGGHGNNGCSPSAGAVGGIAAAPAPRAAGTAVATTSPSRPERMGNTPARADTNPARAASSPQTGAAGTLNRAPSGC